MSDDGFLSDGGSAPITTDRDPTDPVAEALEMQDREHGVVFWIGLAVGWVGIVIGLFGILDHGSQANPFKVFRLLIGLNVFNDAIVIPLVIGLAFVTHRWAPHWLLRPMQMWLIVSGVVSLYAYPLVGSFGKKPSQPSELPFNYAHNLLIVLACITVVFAGLALRSWRQFRRTGS